VRFGEAPIKSERSSPPLAMPWGGDAFDFFFGTSVASMRLPDRRCGTRRLSQHKASGGPRGSDGRAGRLHDSSSGVDDLAVAGPSPSCPTLLRLSHPSVMTAAARARRGGMVPRHLFDAPQALPGPSARRHGDSGDHLSRVAMATRRARGERERALASRRPHQSNPNRSRFQPPPARSDSIRNAVA
jgi:hypothetical protein